MYAKNDAEWTRLCLERDFHTCRFALPGCTSHAIEVHHIVTRSRKALRLLLLNGLSACRNCHNWVEMNSAKAMEVCKAVKEIYEKDSGYKVNL
jgi:nitrate/TMAO reductase-like tetraheme cytochrome c subunit